MLTVREKLHCQESKLTSAKYSAASSTAMLRSPAAQSEKAELHHRNQEETDGGKGGEEGEEGGGRLRV